MPSLIIPFRPEKLIIMHEEVLAVYFKMTTLDLYPELFPGGRGGDFLQWLKRGYSTERFRSLNLRFRQLVYPFHLENERVNDHCSSDSLCWEKKRLHASINMLLQKNIANPRLAEAENFRIWCSYFQSIL
jgi:hypothetical protein